MTFTLLKCHCRILTGLSYILILKNIFPFSFLSCHTSTDHLVFPLSLRSPALWASLRSSASFFLMSCGVPFFQFAASGVGGFFPWTLSWTLLHLPSKLVRGWWTFSLAVWCPAQPLSTLHVVGIVQKSAKWAHIPRVCQQRLVGHVRCSKHVAFLKN